MVVSTDADHITLSADKPQEDARVVDLYEDYSCPHCGDLAKATDDSMKQQIEAGTLIVNVHPLNFLDGGDYGHSTMSGVAAETIAEASEPVVYWNYRKMLFDKQRDIYSAWKMDDFADAAKKMGAANDVVDKIRGEELKDSYEKQAAANSDKLREAIGKVSSPQVIVDGVSLSLANDAGTDFADWPKKLVDGGYDDAIAEGGKATADAK
nr:thioredoxin domain-containing protein [Corynebacterium mendelii]